MVCSPPCANQNHLPKVLRTAWSPLPGAPSREREKRERAPLVWTNVGTQLQGLLHETKSREETLALHRASFNLEPHPSPSEPGLISFNYIQETPVTKDTFLVGQEGVYEKFRGHSPFSSSSIFFFPRNGCVWVANVSTKKVAGMLELGEFWQPIFLNPGRHQVFKCKPLYCRLHWNEKERKKEILLHEKPIKPFQHFPFLSFVPINSSLLIVNFNKILSNKTWLRHVIKLFVHSEVLCFGGL